ncbi:MAG: OadG family protein [Bacteroidaceae bacterium]|nr:OadG family protein [Bacteroidaceae bacterium]
MTLFLLVENATWSDMWAMTGIGFGTVFTILILLVLILGVFNLVAKGSKKTATAKPALPKAAPAIAAKSNADDDDLAAVATALYLFYQEVHDEESFVLTIHHHEHNAWRPEHY